MLELNIIVDIGCRDIICIDQNNNIEGLDVMGRQIIVRQLADDIMK